MNHWFKRIFLFGMLAFSPLFMSLSAQAGPFQMHEGILLRGFGENTSNVPGGIKCKLFNEDAEKIGTSSQVPGPNNTTVHELKLDDGSVFTATTSADLGVTNDIGPMDTLSFPELAPYAGDDSYKILTVSLNGYKGININSWKASGAFEGSKSIEVRCVFLVQMTADGPVVRACIKCHYFIGF